jgi:hypothetical protein
MKEPYQINLQSHLWGDFGGMLAPMNKAINDYTLDKYGYELEDLVSYMSPLLCFDAADEIVQFALNVTKCKWEEAGLLEAWGDIKRKLVEKCYGFKSGYEEQCEITGIVLNCG